MVMLTASMLSAHAQEAYVWVSEKIIDEWGHTTKSLNFCYDNDRATREGATYDLNEGETQPGWITDDIPANYSSIIIEPSFQNARPTSTYKWFYNMYVNEEFTGISYLNTSEVTNMKNMFQITINFEMTLDLSNFDTSKVTDMSGMFRIDGYDYTAQKRLSFVIDVSSFDTSNVTNMDYMFYACSVKSVDVSNFNTSNVTLMRRMFDSCRYLESLDLSSFTIPNEGWRSDQFLYNCASLKELTIPSSARHFTNYSCDKVGTIDKPCHIIAPEGFNFGVDTSGDYFQWKNGYFTLNSNLSAKEFYYYKTNEKTATLYYDDNEERLSDTDNVTLVSQITSIWSWSNYDPIELIIIDPSAKEARPTLFDNMFSFRNLKNVEGIENLNTDNVTSMQCLFSYCSYLPSEVIQNIVDHLNTSKVVKMNYMFSHCTSLKSLDLSKIDVSSIRTMSSMFEGCSNLTDVNFGNFDTSLVTVMDHLFDGCSSLESIDLSKFNTGEVYTMNYMFQGCSKLESLDISNFTSNSLYYTRNMFAGCTNMKNISIGTFNPGKYMEEVSQQYGEDIGSMSGMFSGCSNLEKLDLSTFTIPSIANKSERLLAGCTSLKDLTINTTAANLYADACQGVGTAENPCTINYPEGFDFGVDTSGDYFEWKTGYFIMGNALKEAYAWVSEDGKTLTFCYDGDRATREGTTYDLNGNGEIPAWFGGWSGESSVQKVIFNPSFADVKPTNTYLWFGMMTGLKEIIGLNFLNTSNCTDLGLMFYGSYNLETLDVSNFDISKIDPDYTTYMFGYCRGLEALTISSSMNNLQDEACISVGSADNPCLIIAPEGFDFGVDTSGDYFVWKSGYFTLNPSVIKAYAWMSEDGKTLTFCYDDKKRERVGTTYYLNGEWENPAWFPGWGITSSVQKVVFNPSFADVKPTSTYLWFAYMGELEEITGLNFLNTSNCTNMYCMFYCCLKLKTLDVSNFDISNSIYTGSMLGYCKGLEKLTISSSMGSLDESACQYVGTAENPCLLIAPEGFDFGVDTSGDYFQWKTGYFMRENATPLVTLTGGDNEVPLSEYNGMTVDVELDDYTCQPDKWYSLCVPFDLSNDQLKEAFGDDANIQEMIGCTWDAENLTMSMNFNKVTEILAGKPYLLRVSGAVKDPKFEGVTINSADPLALDFGDCEMIGVLNATPLPLGDKSYLFIINNQFYYPATTNPLPAMRCYFHLLGDAAGANSVALNMEDDPNAIISVITDKAADSGLYHSLQGIATNRPHRGVYIINGKKVVVK